ncbi:hypothetical protein [Clostridium tyrobutyricum]|uniref:hypothetical protein n=1 Tax=Clostridium tyrobutyricum TaxID=1519 RepID=UPI001C381BF4|nr:hypothetical protein [Clostridium tyrobutyricum]MBV4415117.1 hypothetical protein [Clostridium tyrobutyricum]
MGRRFRKGLKYVFTSKKYKKLTGTLPQQVKKINGHMVVPENDFVADCHDFWVIPEWCKCIGRVIE